MANAAPNAFGPQLRRLQKPEFCSGRRSDGREGLAEALAHKGGPVVVDAVVDLEALALPSHVPLHTAEGFTLSFAKKVLSGKTGSVIKTIERNLRLI